MQKRTVTLTEKDLRKLYHSESFLSRLNEAALATKQTGYEHGFAVYKDLTRPRFQFSRIFYGSAEVVRFADDADMARLERACEEKRIHRFFDLHFHTTQGFPVPSGDDLHVLEESVCGLSDRPLLSIGSIRDNGYGYILHLQRSFSRGMIHRGSSLQTDLCENASYAGKKNNMADVCRAMEIPGFIACDYTFFRCGNSGTQSTIERKPCFSRFAYSTASP